MRRREFVKWGASAAAVWPLIARAQQKAVPAIGFLSSGNAADGPNAGFFQGMSETGHGEGQDLAIEYRWAQGRYDRLPAFAPDLVGRKVEVIATTGMPSALSAKSADQTIPIVLHVGTDPAI